MEGITLAEYRKKSDHNSSWNRPNNFGKEGTDHLNISIQSSSPVGRMLDPGYCCNFDHPHLGRFKSVLALTYWLKSPTKDDAIRNLKGHRLKRYIAEHKLHGIRLPNYYDIVARATWIRLMSRPDIVQRIKELPDDLELVSYYTDKLSGVRITTNYARSVVKISKELIEAIKEDRYPDFKQFVTEPELAGKAFLESVMQR